MKRLILGLGLLVLPVAGMAAPLTCMEVIQVRGGEQAQIDAMVAQGVQPDVPACLQKLRFDDTLIEVAASNVQAGSLNPLALPEGARRSEEIPGWQPGNKKLFLGGMALAGGATVLFISGYVTLIEVLMDGRAPTGTTLAVIGGTSMVVGTVVMIQGSVERSADRDARTGVTLRLRVGPRSLALQGRF